MKSRILVVGDIILDEYVYGSVSRVSPEAPVPVFDYSGKTETKLGGAANVAANIKSLDPDCSVDIIGYCSNEASALLSKKITPLTDRCYDYSAIKKTRFVSGKHQLLRVDYPSKFPNPLNIDELSELDFKYYNLVVISDYNKGTVDSSIISKIKKCFKGNVLVEAKNARKYFSLDSVIFKCNEKEWESQKEIVGFSAFKTVIVTKSEKGYSILSNSGNILNFPSSISQDDILDVVGAGDVFLAGMAVTLSDPRQPASLEDQIKRACEFGNKAAGESVKHFGTVEVKREWMK